MGIDLSTYRGRIGRFNNRGYRAKTGKVDTINVNSNLWSWGLVIAVLLVIGGVELNPGPDTESLENMVKFLCKEIKEMKEGFKTMQLGIESKLNEFSETIGGVQRSNEENQKQMQELKEENRTIKMKLENLLVNNKKKNIIIFGLREERFEKKLDTWETVRELFIRIFQLNLHEDQIEDIFRIGRGTNRAVLVKFSSLITKEILMSRLRALRGTGIRIENDYDYATRQRRKQLLPYLIEARKNGKFATLVKDKLKIEGRVFDLEYCINNFTAVSDNRRRAENERNTMESSQDGTMNKDRSSKTLHVENGSVWRTNPGACGEGGLRRDEGIDPVRDDVMVAAGTSSHTPPPVLTSQPRREQNVWSQQKSQVQREGGGTASQENQRSQQNWSARKKNLTTVSSPQGSIIEVADDPPARNLRSWVLSGDKLKSKVNT